MPEGSYKKFGFESSLQWRLTFPGVSHVFAKVASLLQKTLKTMQMGTFDMGKGETHELNRGPGFSRGYVIIGRLNKHSGVTKRFYNRSSRLSKSF